jgi:hypothetical protein
MQQRGSGSSGAPPGVGPGRLPSHAAAAPFDAYGKGHGGGERGRGGAGTPTGGTPRAGTGAAAAGASAPAAPGSPAGGSRRAGAAAAALAAHPGVARTSFVSAAAAHTAALRAAVPEPAAATAAAPAARPRSASCGRAGAFDGRERVPSPYGSPSLRCVRAATYALRACCRSRRPGLRS